MSDIKKTVSYLNERIPFTPEIVIILGSGLGILSGMVNDPVVIPYSDIPGFSSTTVAGHAQELIAGTIHDKKVLLMNGRFHYYEGHSMDTVTFPMRVFSALGINKLIVTNAAGGVGDGLNPGSIMLITDHISVFCPSPLIGANLDEFGPRFPDMSQIYSEDMIQKARMVAASLNISINEGVYFYLTGPQYESPAEIRMVRAMGGDAVGMSTVPEVIVAKHCGMEILGISLITNKAAGLGQKKLEHSEVISTARLAQDNLTGLVSTLIGYL